MNSEYIITRFFFTHTVQPACSTSRNKQNCLLCQSCESYSSSRQNSEYINKVFPHTQCRQHEPLLQKKKREKQALAPSSVTVNTAVLVGSHKPSSVEFGNHLEMPSADRSVCRQIIGVFASETEIMVSVAELSVLQAPLSLSLTLFFFV